ncbi:hypothetical protein BLS_003314 [Venturia inaequalis]|uniref:Uncharacterized protein n=1 Tax=Venturia inaequalis TaxID=5025 RepID=A0A8H3UP85_VENIN|nr:hypothetical protein EG327_010314 [Venturia inaequalis]KAE9973994.1 hypothetical protein BLS_003314 [Venturia inaequalis]KAE9974475.1 hypothetical protein EG328_003805 [Venturia inaequalis]RDI86738.1 hypothetical protein Vi05172_g3176 [Venturia inaequalis]
MKFSAVIALSIAALASAQVPKGSGADAPKIPAGIKCALTCLAPLKESGCKIDGIFPKGAGTGATRIAGRPPGDLAKPAGQVVDTPQMRKVRRQGDSPAKAPPKISPETIAAAKTARDCFCAAPAMKTVQPCITSGCASAPDGGAAAVKGINAACKAVTSFTPLTPAPAAAGGAAPPA